MKRQSTEWKKLSVRTNIWNVQKNNNHKNKTTKQLRTIKKTNNLILKTRYGTKPFSQKQKCK